MKITGNIGTDLKKISEIYNLNPDQLKVIWAANRLGFSHVLCMDKATRNAEAGCLDLVPEHIRKINLIYSKYFESTEQVV
ncbi:MAG: hypothetical protein KKB34_19920 [Bacteroidetes bacterium]|nr:hypothetical protein [Bacteroidota bacterium]